MTNSAAPSKLNAELNEPTGQLVFEINGDDATRFLHAQLTSDVESQTPGSFSWTSWLTPKGRVISVMGIIRIDVNRYLLIVPASLADAVAKRLKMFVMRSKVEIVSQRWQQSLQTGAMAEESLGLSTLNEHRLSISDDRILVHLESNSAVKQIGVLCITKADGDAVAPSNQSSWQRWCVSNGLPWIVEATSDSFIPQSLNLDATGGLSFEKGCYPGQEIVARTHFKGRLKYRTAVLEFDDDLALESGMKLTQESDQARSATVLTASDEGLRVTAVVPVQWFEHAGDFAVTVQRGSEQSAEDCSTDHSAQPTRVDLIPPAYELSLS